MTKRSDRKAGSRLASMLAGAIVTAIALVAAAALTSGDAGARSQAAPQNTTEPSISGTPTVGQTLTATPGVWTGTTPITFAYQWRRCDTSGANCASIPGETNTTRLVDSGDVGSTLRVRVTATNVNGSVSAESNATSTVAASGSGGPVNTQEPSISGTAVQGQVLSAAPGTWSGATPIAFSYQWQRCDSNGSSCTSIAGETGTTRTVDPGDVGSRLRVRVTATNSSGSANATSSATSVITGTASGSAPKNTAAPSISGTATQGQKLTTSTGTWTGSTPITYAYQWLRCDANSANCASITGETTSTRTVDSGDVGSRLKVHVTATNGSGSASVDSAVTEIVKGSGTPSTLPPGAVTLPDGKISIPVTSVPLTERLLVDVVRFNPNPVNSTQTPIVVRVHLMDTRGFVVRDALVFVRSVPVVTSTPPEAATAQDGWVTFQLLPRADFPLRAGHNVQFFVRARRTGDNPLAGVSTRRLVQVRTTG